MPDFRTSIRVIAPVSICLFVIALPDQRNATSFRGLFAERGMVLVSIAPSSGCYRVGSYRYVARTASGTVERGLICVNKSMRVFGMTPSSANAAQN